MRSTQESSNRVSRESRVKRWQGGHTGNGWTVKSDIKSRGRWLSGWSSCFVSVGWGWLAEFGSPPSTYVRHGSVCICNPSARWRRVTEACWSSSLSKLGATGSVTVLASTGKIGTNRGRQLIWAPGAECMSHWPGYTRACMHAHTHTQRKQKAKREGVTLNKESSKSVIFVLIAYLEWWLKSTQGWAVFKILIFLKIIFTFYFYVSVYLFSLYVRGHFARTLYVRLVHAVPNRGQAGTAL